MKVKGNTNKGGDMNGVSSKPGDSLHMLPIQIDGFTVTTRHIKNCGQIVVVKNPIDEYIAEFYTASHHPTDPYLEAIDNAILFAKAKAERYKRLSKKAIRNR